MGRCLLSSSPIPLSLRFPPIPKSFAPVPSPKNGLRPRRMPIHAKPTRDLQIKAVISEFSSKNQYSKVGAESTGPIPAAELLQVVETAAKAGAEVVMEAVNKPRNINYKGITDLVTDTDRMSESTILEVVKKNFKDHLILGEEGGLIGDSMSDYLWCIDPLDGTTNFAHGYPSFGVSVGVLFHGKPAAASVVEFVGGAMCWNTRTFSASSGGGAFCNGQKIHVSQTDQVERSLLVTGFGYEHDDAWATNINLFKEFTDISRGVRRLGAAAVDMSHVALGIVEAYWEYRLKPWDMAAGVLVKNRIEHCLTLHMNKKQTVETLWKEEKIERVFTETVWERLQQDNHDFFMAYYVRLLLKEQIAVFNMLLGKQANSMEQGTGHASTSSAGQYMPSNANHLIAIKDVGSSGNSNIQVGAGDLFPAERMGILRKIPEHCTGHASTSWAVQYMQSNANPFFTIKDVGSSENSNIQVGAGDLFPADRTGIPRKIPKHGTGHASTSWAAQYMPSNANPLIAIKDVGSSGNSNIQVGVGDLFPTERMGIPRKIPDHATRHASTSWAAQDMPSNANPLIAINDVGSSENLNIQVSAGDLFSAERMGIPRKIPDHATRHASTSWAAQYMPSNANPLIAIKDVGPSGYPSILAGASDLFPTERIDIPEKIPDHATGHASTCLAAQYMPSNANPLISIQDVGSLGNPNIQMIEEQITTAKASFMMIPEDDQFHFLAMLSRLIEAEEKFCK